MKLLFSFHFGCILFNGKKNGSKSPSHFQVFSEEVQPSLHTIFIAFHKIDTQSVPNSC